MGIAPQPFTYNVSDEALADLRSRLSATRLPDQAPGEAWAYGTEVSYLRDLIDYWRTAFDWRAQEAALNAFPQFKVPLHDINIHFLHVAGKGPNPIPLLLLHGWPGSVFEFLDIIPRLTDPARFGGDPADAFTIVAPSLPGYGLSFQPGQKRFAIPDIAACVADLMTEVLGYQRYAAQGGDWGAAVSSCLGRSHAGPLVGIHPNMLALRRDVPAPSQPLPDEQRFFDEMGVWTRERSGYGMIQGTRPQTLSFGLSDSPAGLAAWIAEKFYAWSDCDGIIESAIDRDRMLGNISLYWFTGAIGSSFWPYYGVRHSAFFLDGGTIDVPMGYVAFPKEIARPPRSIAEQTYANIQRWTEMPRGGHFAALEQPEALACDVQAFFRPLR